MTALAFLIPLSILIVTLATGLLLWAIRNGQYQDLSNRMPDDAPNEADGQNPTLSSKRTLSSKLDRQQP